MEINQQEPEGGQDITILVHRKKKATTREELEKFSNTVHIVFLTTRFD